jgi:Fur family ferric uptake transcriptional regulator
VHLSTIYRNLEELQKLGVVVHTHLGHGPITFQLAAHAHAHLICDRCGARFEVADELFSTLAERARKELGFTIDPHHAAIFGRCASCAGA